MGCSLLNGGSGGKDSCDFSEINLNISLESWRSTDFPFPWTPFDPTVVPPGTVAVSVQWELTGTQPGDQIRWFIGEGDWVPDEDDALFLDLGSAFGVGGGFFNDFKVIKIWEYQPLNIPINDPNSDSERIRAVIRRSGCEASLITTHIEEIKGTKTDVFGNGAKWELFIDGVLVQTVLP